MFNLKCILGHKYRVIDSQKFIDGSFGIRMTRLLQQCKNCKKLKVKTIQGHFDEIPLDEEAA